MAEKKGGMFLGIPDVFWMGFIIMVGFFLKLVYDVQIGYTVGTPNAGVWREMVNGIPNEGHIGVIQYIFTYHAFPNVDLSQYGEFTNPPLFYWISALILDVIHRWMGWAIGTSLHVIQCINVIYVTVGSTCGVSMAFRLGVRKRKLTVVILFMTFFPSFYHLSAGLTPDALCFMLSMLSLNSALSWYTSRRSRTFLVMSVQLGLALMTSFYAIFLLPPIILLYRSASQDGRRNQTPLRTQMIRMVVIVLLLGAWWPLFRYIRYGIPLYYSAIAAGGTEIRDYHLLQRIWPPGGSLYNHLHTIGDVTREYNIWAQTFRTGVFRFTGIELTGSEVTAMAAFTLRLSVGVCLLMHVMWCYVMFTERLDRPMKRFILGGYLSYLVGYIWLCMAYPYIEMMDFTRIAPILIFPVIGMGVCGYGYGHENLFEKITSFLANGLILIFALLTAFLMGFYP